MLQILKVTPVWGDYVATNVMRLLSLETSLPASQMQAALIEVKIAVNISRSAFCFLRRRAVLISSFQLRYSCGRSGHSCSLYGAYIVVSRAFRECCFDPSPTVQVCVASTHSMPMVSCLLIDWLLTCLMMRYEEPRPTQCCRADDGDNKWCFRL